MLNLDFINITDLTFIQDIQNEHRCIKLLELNLKQVSTFLTKHASKGM